MKTAGMAKIFFTVLVLFIWVVSAKAQERDRYRFAHSYLGLQTSWLAPSESGNPSFFTTRVSIGGMHFWNRADFYVSFPLTSSNLLANSDWKYHEGVITGGRYLPLGLSSKYPTPYVGLQWIGPSFSAGKGPTIDRSRLGLEAGFIWVKRKTWSIQLGCHATLQNQLDYYTSRSTTEALKLPAFAIDIGIKKHIDFTAGLSSEGSKKFRAATEIKMAEDKTENTWGIGIGPSASIGTSNIPFLEEYAWLPSKNGAGIHFDFGVSHYWSKPDLALRLSYRPSRKQIDAHGFNTTFKQQRISLEAFKFLFDYKGFVPFLGIGAGTSFIDFNAADNGTNIASVSEWIPSASLVFGWDIRPTQVEWFILRTNLRYTPPMNVEANELNVIGGELEFNFIQFVCYPARMKYYFKS